MRCPFSDCLSEASPATAGDPGATSSPPPKFFCPLNGGPATPAPALPERDIFCLQGHGQLRGMRIRLDYHDLKTTPCRTKCQRDLFLEEAATLPGHRQADGGPHESASRRLWSHPNLSRTLLSYLAELMRSAHSADLICQKAPNALALFLLCFAFLCFVLP